MTRRRKSAFKASRAFTLIELLIVIAIVLILIAIALPNFLEAQVRARIARTWADLRTVATAMESYYLDWGIYPPDHDPNVASAPHRPESGLFQLTTPLTYLPQLPEDIFNQGNVGMTGAGDEQRWYEMASTGLRQVELNLIGPPVVNAYAVFSKGPDVDDDFADNNDWPYDPGKQSPCTDGIGYLNYSPTNGTRSSGDLVQPGGEVNSGLYCVDHWKVISGRRPIYKTGPN